MSGFLRAMNAGKRRLGGWSTSSYKYDTLPNQSNHDCSNSNSDAPDTEDNSESPPRVQSRLTRTNGSQRRQRDVRRHNVPSHKGSLAKSRAVKMAIIGVLVLLAMAFVTAALASRNGTNPSCDTIEAGYECAPEISHAWGQYSPYFSVQSKISHAIPAHCSVTFAQVLSRHGARDPTSTKSNDYALLIQKIQRSAKSYGRGYEFLRSFEYKLGKDQLTKFGAQQMYNSGAKFYSRYHTVVNATTLSPFYRISGEQRVIDSARNFSLGFLAASGQFINDTADFRAADDNMVIIPEGPGFNNTLNHDLCDNFENGPISEIRDTKQQWANVFVPPIQQRVNQNLPGANLTNKDIIKLMDMCPFITVSDTNPSNGGPSNGRFAAGRYQWRKYSPFFDLCSLFSPSEWQDYSYYQTLDKWYGFGPGNPLGPTQGVGFVNELIARLTDGRVLPAANATASANVTLNADPRTFPLGRRLYADFSHDNDMVAIMSALELWQDVKDLSTHERPQGFEADGNPGEGHDDGSDSEDDPVFDNEFPRTGGFSAARIVPFAARVYVEAMVCMAGGAKYEEPWVRVLVNDRVMPLRSCGGDEYGRCRLDRFVESLSFARHGGRWNECFTQ